MLFRFFNGTGMAPAPIHLPLFSTRTLYQRRSTQVIIVTLASVCVLVILCSLAWLVVEEAKLLPICDEHGESLTERSLAVSIVSAVIRFIQICFGMKRHHRVGHENEDDAGNEVDDDDSDRFNQHVVRQRRKHDEEVAQGRQGDFSWPAPYELPSRLTRAGGFGPTPLAYPRNRGEDGFLRGRR